MCTTTECREFNKEMSRNVRDMVANFILTDWFWKKAREVQNIMDPLIRVLKIMDMITTHMIIIVLKDIYRGWV